MFLVFFGDDYYPSGGANDFKIAFPHLDHAIAFAKGATLTALTWAHVAELAEDQLKIVWDSRDHA